MGGSRWAPNRTVDDARDPGVARVRDSGSPISPVDSPRSINFSRPMSPQMVQNAAPTDMNMPSRGGSNVAQAQRAPSLGLTPEQLRRLEERREATRLQEQEWIERERKRNEAQTIARQGAQRQSQPSTDYVSSLISKSASPTQGRPQSSGNNNLSGLRASAHSPTQSSPQAVPRQQTLQTPRTRPMSMPVAINPNIPQTSRSQPQNDARRGTHDRQSARSVSNPQSTSAQIRNIPSPTDEQIKSFQTRAASLLASPPRDSPIATSVRPPSSQQPRTAQSRAESDVNASRNRSVSTPMVSPHPTLSIERGRDTSASPARSAHFSKSPLLEVTKHTPPPRSVSPVKSALKGSSSRNASPNLTFNSRDKGDLSDEKSVLSDESSIPSEKKKKSVRVSFEERPALVGNAAGDTDSPIDTIMSPQYKRRSGDVESGNETDFSMTPRPTLPSFGSVRGRKIRGTDSTPSPLAVTRRVSDSGEANPLIEAAAHRRNSDEVDDSSTGADATRSQDAPKGTSALSAPEIAVMPATPRAEEQNQLQGSAQDIETSHAAHDLEESLTAAEALIADQNRSKTISEMPGEAGDNKADIDAPQFKEAIRSGLVLKQTGHESDSTSEEDDEDYFSDTVEDQSELENVGGFASLDAIIESPGREGMENTDPLDTAVNSSGPSSERGVPETIKIDDDSDTLATTQEDWNVMKAYWSSLNEQQKLAMEQQNQPPVLSSPDNKSTAPASASTTGMNSASKATEDATSKPRKAQPNRPSQKPPQPKKSAMKSSPPSHNRASSDTTHLRQSMRHSGSMMSSMRGPPERSPSRSSQSQNQPRSSAPQASAEALAIAKATAKSMQAKAAERKASREADSEELRRGRTPPKDFHYNFKRSMRDGQPQAPDARPQSASIRPSVEPSSESKSGGFLGFGKSKAKPSKVKKPNKSSAGSGGRFRSRFADSSDEDSDGGLGSRLNFRSRFADSDDSSDDEVKPMQIKLAPVRGIPRPKGQDAGDSTELEDSDDEQSPSRAVHPRQHERKTSSSKDRPGTPPTSQVLSFRKSSGPAGIDVDSKTQTPEKAPLQSPTLASSPPQPNGNQANGHATEGKALAAGTLRKEEPDQERLKRHSLLSFGKKPKPGLADSKWASPPNSPSSRPQTPSKGFAKTLRDNKDGKDKPKRHSMLRRLSATSKDSDGSALMSPTEAKAAKEDFPFPPPPIPEEYKSPTSPDTKRPNTSDGLSPSVSKPDTGESAQRPSMGEKRVSTMTAPTTIDGRAVDQRAPGDRHDPIVSLRTGKKKKFQGLRRALRLND